MNTNNLTNFEQKKALIHDRISNFLLNQTITPINRSIIISEEAKDENRETLTNQIELKNEGDTSYESIFEEIKPDMDEELIDQLVVYDINTIQTNFDKIFKLSDTFNYFLKTVRSNGCNLGDNTFMIHVKIIPTNEYHLTLKELKFQKLNNVVREVPRFEGGF